jgi:DNA-binding NarL/FixJ family response regulator
LDIVATAATAAEVADWDGSIPADLAVCDLYLAGGDSPSVDAISELAKRCPTLVVSCVINPVDVLAALESGACGFVTTSAQSEVLVAAVRTATAVAAAEAQSALSFNLFQAAADRSHIVDLLSGRELEALRYIARGLTHQQTATRMGVAKATVDTYVARIRTKLRLGNKAELTRAALMCPDYA